MSYHRDVDLPLFPPDQVLPEPLDVPGVQGHYREVADLTRRTGTPLAQLGHQYGAGRTASGFTGTARDIADRMEEWHAMGARDGFMIQVPFIPGGLESFARLVVLELQRRGPFRDAYSGPTLRDHLESARPAA